MMTAKKQNIYRIYASSIVCIHCSQRYLLPFRYLLIYCMYLIYALYIYTVIIHSLRYIIGIVLDIIIIHLNSERLSYDYKIYRSYDRHTS